MMTKEFGAQHNRRVRERALAPARAFGSGTLALGGNGGGLYPSLNAGAAAAPGQEPQMRTLYAACLAMVGLSQEDAQELHRVRLDTVRNWATGRRPVPAGAWDELRDYAREIRDTTEALRRELGESGCRDVLGAWTARGSTMREDDRLEPRYVMAFAALLLEPVEEEEALSALSLSQDAGNLGSE